MYTYKQDSIFKATVGTNWTTPIKKQQSSRSHSVYLNTKHEPDLGPECDEASRDTEWYTHELPNSAGKLAQPTWHAAGGDQG